MIVLVRHASDGSKQTTNESADEAAKLIYEAGYGREFGAQIDSEAKPYCQSPTYLVEFSGTELAHGPVLLKHDHPPCWTVLFWNANVPEDEMIVARNGSNNLDESVCFFANLFFVKNGPPEVAIIIIAPLAHMNDAARP